MSAHRTTTLGGGVSVITQGGTGRFYSNAYCNGQRIAVNINSDGAACIDDAHSAAVRRLSEWSSALSNAARRERARLVQARSEQGAA